MRMSFGDVSARFKKKAEEVAPPPPVERNHAEVYALRAKILGVLMRDARLANGTTEAEVAHVLGVSEDQVRDWEYGREAPSLPQLEMLAFYLDIPVSHFWSTKTMSAEQDERQVPQGGSYGELRDRIIGAMLTSARQGAKLSQEELANATGLTPEKIAAYEYGHQSIPFPELTSISTAVRQSISYFLESENRIGSELALREEYRRFTELPEQMRAFVTQPVNQAFIDIAMRLSRLQVQELREVGENILNITL
jgi:transcriptional regulator with XRE-family HTH domain